MFQNKLYTVAAAIAALGAIHLGVVAVFHVDLLTKIGELIKHQEEFLRISHIVFGLCGVYALFEVLRCCTHCEVKK